MESEGVGKLTVKSRSQAFVSRRTAWGNDYHVEAPPLADVGSILTVSANALFITEHLHKYDHALKA